MSEGQPQFPQSTEFAQFVGALGRAGRSGRQATGGEASVRGGGASAEPREAGMFEQMTRHWWVLALRGAFAILFGVIAWIWPDITVWALVILFGAYALVDGVFALGAAFRGTRGQPRGLLAVSGI